MDQNIEKTEEAQGAREPKQEVAGSLDEIFVRFAACKQSGAEPSSLEAKHVVAELQKYITVTQYECTNQILSFLGEVYVRDPRFLKAIDRHGEGTAAFASEAIKSYCKE